MKVREQAFFLVAACGHAFPADGELERAVLSADPGVGIARLDRVGVEAKRLCEEEHRTGSVPGRDSRGLARHRAQEHPMSDLIDLVAVIRNDRVVALGGGGTRQSLSGGGSGRRLRPVTESVANWVEI